MKKVSAILVVLAVIFCFASVAMASEVMLQKQIKNIVFKNDKNGRPYARIIIDDKATLNGVTYDKTVSVMAFGDTVAQVKGLKAGSTIKAIASVGEYKGNKTYTILKVVR